MKKLITALTLFLSLFCFSAIAVNTPQSAAVNNKAMAAKPMPNDKERMIIMMKSYSGMKMARIAHRMMKMGMKVRMLGMSLQSSQDPMLVSNGKKTQAMGEQMYMMGKKMMRMAKPMIPPGAMIYRRIHKHVHPGPYQNMPPAKPMPKN